MCRWKLRESGQRVLGCAFVELCVIREREKKQLGFLVSYSLYAREVVIFLVFSCLSRKHGMDTEWLKYVFEGTSSVL